MFVFGRHVVAVEVEEFAAEQADAVCAEVVQGFDVFGGFDVGQKFDVDAVGRGGGGFFDFVEFALVAAVFAGEAAVFVEDDFVGIDDEDAVDAVDDDDFVFGNEFAGVVQADDGRDVEAAA